MVQWRFNVHFIIDFIDDSKNNAVSECAHILLHETRKSKTLSE